jgi:hypothetical protein
MSTVHVADALGRPVVSEPIKAHIQAAFQAVPPGKRGALLIIADERGTRAHLAAKLGDHWKVAGGSGWTWGSTRPSGWVAIEGTW